MLLKTNDRRKKESFYPTMSMIISVLFEFLDKAAFYFQHDSLWKNMKMAWNTGRTHDVYEQKWVSPKEKKASHLFSIAYRQENDVNYGAICTEPTISMVEKDLRANRQLVAIFYIIENKARSYLASESNGFRTHDVHGRKGVKGKSRIPTIFYLI